MIIQEVPVKYELGQNDTITICTDVNYQNEYKEFKEINGPFVNEFSAALAFSLLIAIPTGRA
jgi:hypothetical protein